MFKDALGNIQFELWQGIKINGRTFQSLPLFNLCREFGDAQVLDACTHLGCFPCIADLSSIRHECERVEARYV
jgi:hypothetical protein